MTRWSARESRRGFALMAALWLIVLVGVTGYELSVRSRTQRLAVANSLEQVQANGAAAAGLETMHALLERRLAHPFNNSTRSFGSTTTDPLASLSFIRHDTLQLGEERTTTFVYDAGSRLQINRATEGDLRRFLAGVLLDGNVADRVAQCILDWRDADDFRRARGAEREDYLRVGARALPSNAEFSTVEELKDVLGITPEIYASIVPYIAVYGSGRVNVNSAPRAVLRALPGLTTEAIDVLLRTQQSGLRLRSLEELSQRLTSGARGVLLDATPELTSRTTFETQEIIVEADGWVNGSPLRTRATALYERSGDVLLTAWRRTR